MLTPARRVAGFVISFIFNNGKLSLKTDVFVDIYQQIYIIFYTLIKMIYYSVCIWFIIVIFIITIFITFVSISNCIEYKKVINSNGNEDISSERANFLFIVNIIESIISIILFFWRVYIWIYSRKKKIEK